VRASGRRWHEPRRVWEYACAVLPGHRLWSTTVVALALLCIVVSASSAAAPRSEPRVPLADVMGHLAALQRIADRHGGQRSAGTPGYDASARYVAGRMRAAGYRVRFQEFSFPFVADRSPPELRPPGLPGWSYRAGRDYATLGYSGTGRVEGRVAPVDILLPSPSPNVSTSGCETSDFAGFPRGAVALLQRGTCTFRSKVENAMSAGASAAIVFNDGSAGRRALFSGTLGAPQADVPVLAASFALGDALRQRVSDAGPSGVVVELSADMIVERRRTRNVVADSRTGSAANVVVVGAHLDSVERGPGINDNGSGSAGILGVAERLARERPRNRLRFVWWGAEELGLLGSRHYVDRLSAAERRRHALYLNFDMVGSPNYALFVYDGDRSSSRSRTSLPPGSAAIERVFTRYFASRRLPYRVAPLGGGSDHAPFARVGIPVGGLFTGAEGRKSATQEAAFGGRAGRPYDPCYHRPCDTLSGVNRTALHQVAQAAAHAVLRFAQDVSDVRRAR
jgi:Zn-dependent M28 family amino/carboxypeptidase